MDITTTQHPNNSWVVRPEAPGVQSWGFEVGQEDEARLANFVAIVAAKNGMSRNDIHYVFPYILRMLKSDIQWAK